jgi:hypothetical protein
LDLTPTLIFPLKAGPILFIILRIQNGPLADKPFMDPWASVLPAARELQQHAARASLQHDPYGEEADFSPRYGGSAAKTSLQDDEYENAPRYADAAGAAFEFSSRQAEAAPESGTSPDKIVQEAGIKPAERGPKAGNIAEAVKDKIAAEPNLVQNMSRLLPENDRSLGLPVMPGSPAHRLLFKSPAKVKQRFVLIS